MRIFQRDFAGGIALAGIVIAGRVIEIVREDVPQPGQQFGFMQSLEGGEIAVRFEQGLLHQIRCLALGPQLAAELHVRQQLEVIAISLEKGFAGLGFARTAASDQV